MSDIPQLVEESRRVAHRKSRWLALAGAMVVVGLVFQGVQLARAGENLQRVLALGEANHQLLGDRNAELQAQVDASRVILTQLYAALNASQKQVIDLGGTPIHFEFTVPTTTTTTTAPSRGPPSSQNADGPEVSASAAIEALIISPVSVSLPPDVIVPPELTLPPVSIPAEITVPTLPDVTTTDLTVPPDITLPTP